MHDMKLFLAAAMEMAKGAGEIQLRYFRTEGLKSDTKQNSFDVVTVADKESERFIKTHISEKFPDHGIIAEESGEDHSEREWRWVIDPLDGTTNFNAGLPIFSVSIALEHFGDPVVGVVYAPYLGELFHAVKGEGAYMNGKRISCSLKSSLDTAVVATGMPYDRAVNKDNNLEEISRVVCRVRGTRRMGSAAIDLSYVAAGYYDAYWELNLNRWDVAAGSLIAREAGAVVESIRDNRNYSILASSPALIDKIRPLLVR